MRHGFYSPYFISKKGGGLRPILDLRVLNRVLHKLPFKMLTHRRMINYIKPQDWFAAIDLKDAYFHDLKTVPTVCVRRSGMAIQGPPLRALPVSQCVHEGRRRILNKLDDWVILAQSREQLSGHRDLVLQHLSQLGLWVNWEKSKLSPVQRISFLGVDLDSVRMTEERAQAVLNCLSSFRGRNVVPLKLLGNMASAAAVTPLGLLHMRPHTALATSRVPRWAWRRGTLRVGITQQCRRSLSPWTDLAFLWAGVPLEQVSRHTFVTTNAPARAGRYMQQAGSLEVLDRAPTALAHQLPRAVSSAFSLTAVLATAVGQARASPHGQHCGRLVHQTAGRYTITPHVTARRHVLLWSHMQFQSLRDVHIPWKLNRAADALSRRLTFPGEWRLHPETIRLIWNRFGEAQVDLFASPKSSHCQLYFSLTEGPSPQTHWHTAGLRPYASMRFPQ